MRYTLIEKWERIGLIFSVAILISAGLLEVFANCWAKNYPTIISILTGLAGGFIATIIVLYFERKHRKNKLHNNYSKISGSYIRFDIGQDNTPKSTVTNLNDVLHPSEIISESPSLQEDNRKLPIELYYQGENTFSIKADYWYSKKCKVEAIIEFIESNKLIAQGRYLYTEGEFKGHFGTYTIYKFHEDDNKLLVLYQHIYPREIDFNPDSNKGWEIWQKIEPEQL